MAVVHTDDDARRFRYRWLGPRNMRMPFDFNGAQWAVGAVAAITVLSVSILVIKPPPITWLFVLGAAFAAHWAAGRWIGPYITESDTGLGYHIATLRVETRALRESVIPTVRRRALTPARGAARQKGTR